MKILNFGSLNIDYVYHVSHFVRPGETISSTRQDVFCGGKGLNQSIALARAGANVYHAGCVGEDGQFLRRALEISGANVDYLETIDGQTGHAIIQVDDEGENSILLFGGANQKITSEQIDKTLEHFGEGDFLLLQNEISLIPEIMARAHAKGLKVVLNPAPMTPEVLEFPLDTVSYFIVNEVEAMDLAQTSEADDALVLISQRFPNATVVLTMGAQGALVRTPDGLQQSVESIKVDVKDTTAAGDTFIGYFLSALASGQDLKEALLLATKAAAISVTREGAEPSIPTKDEVVV